jgi:UDP-glucose 4-epimerase
VTGATGFIGRHVLATAHARGWKLRATGLNADRVEVSGGTPVEVIAQDLSTGFDAGLLDGVTAVCHLGTFIPPDQQDPVSAERCLQVNALGTLRILEAIAACDQRPHLVVASTANAYAPDLIFARETDSMPPGPRASFYFASKIAAEFYVEGFRRQRGVGAAILRFTSVYGPGMPLGGMIGRFITGLRRGGRIDVHGGGRVRCDAVAVSDVAEAAVRAVERRAEGVFNIGGGRVWTNGEVASCIARLVGAQVEAIRVVAADPAKPMDPGFPGADIARARAELDFVPTDLETGLRRMLTEDPRLSGELG